MFILRKYYLIRNLYKNDYGKYSKNRNWNSSNLYFTNVDKLLLDFI